MPRQIHRYYDLYESVYRNNNKYKYRATTIVPKIRQLEMNSFLLITPISFPSL